MIAGRFQPIGPAVRGAPIKARDLETAQTVMLMDVPTLDPRVVGLFHPALLTVFAIVEHEGRQLAAAEFVHGRTLAEVLGGEPCHPRRAAEIVSELADGVAELHAAGVCHGSIGVTSAILTAKGKAKLTLTTAIGGSEADDLKLLRDLLSAIGGRATAEADSAQSAAVLAASLRT